MSYKFGRFRSDREEMSNILEQNGEDRLARKVSRGECLSWSEKNRVQTELERSDRYNLSMDYGSCFCEEDEN